MQKEAYFTEGKILGNIAYYCLQYQVILEIYNTRDGLKLFTLLMGMRGHAKWFC